MNIVFGINALDNLLPNALIPGSLIVIAGHPGSAKTTFASTICYSNTAKGHRCLYLTFQESKEKFYIFMKNIGMDFEPLEEKGLFKFLKIPISSDLEKVVEVINETVNNWNPRIIVVDSINVLLNAVEKDEVKRAWLQNYFYSLSEAVKGVAILIAEVPFGEEKVQLGSIEFVADIVLILRNRVERGLISRYLEIRKVRGAPLTLAELSFTILPNKGIEVFVPPLLVETPVPTAKLKGPCSVLDNVLGEIDKGYSIYIEHPPDFRVPEAVPIILGIALRNNLKAVYISYRYTPDPLLGLLTRSYRRYCHDIEKIMKVLRRHVIAVSLNPFRYSLAEGLAKEFETIRESQADLVIFHAVEIPAMTEKYLPEYLPSLYNQVNVLKQQHKVVVRIYSPFDEMLSKAYASIADLVMKYIPTEDMQDYKVYVWRRGSKPVILSSKDIEKCVEEISLNMCKEE